MVSPESRMVIGPTIEPLPEANRCSSSRSESMRDLEVLDDGVGLVLLLEGVLLACRRWCAWSCSRGRGCWWSCPSSMSSLQASETRNVCMNFLAIADVEEVALLPLVPELDEPLLLVEASRWRASGWGSRRRGSCPLGRLEDRLGQLLDLRHRLLVDRVQPGPCAYSCSVLGAPRPPGGLLRLLLQRRVVVPRASLSAREPAEPSRSSSARSCSVTLAASFRNSRLIGSGLLPGDLADGLGHLLDVELEDGCGAGPGSRRASSCGCAPPACARTPGRPAGSPA